MGNILHELERAEDDAHLAYLRSEVARLRLTDAEREAVLAMACHCDTRSGLEWVRLSATLRGLLSRTGDCPAQDNAADRDNGTIGHQDSPVTEPLPKERRA